MNRIRENSDNPLWFDGSRAMKIITNTISHKIDAKYIVPTKINMEDGLLEKIMEERKRLVVNFESIGKFSMVK